MIYEKMKIKGWDRGKIMPREKSALSLHCGDSADV